MQIDLMAEQNNLYNQEVFQLQANVDQTANDVREIQKTNDKLQQSSDDLKGQLVYIFYLAHTHSHIFFFFALLIFIYFCFATTNAESI